MRPDVDERGSITVWLALSSFVMIVLVGLTVDLGGQVHAHERAHDGHTRRYDPIAVRETQ